MRGIPGITLRRLPIRARSREDLKVNLVCGLDIAIIVGYYCLHISRGTPGGWGVS